MSKFLTPAVRALTTRTVHLKVNPSPRTFAEQREVLRVIERFGEVSVFKNLKYDPHRPIHNAFLAVFNSASSARDLINVSPLRYRLISASSNSASPDGLEDDTTDSKVFNLAASETSYSHNGFIRSSRLNPLHGPYVPVSQKASYKTAALSKIVPDSNWSEGLVDWDTEKNIWRNDGILAPEEDIPSEKHGQSAQAIGEPQFRREPRMGRESTTPMIMGGLQSLWRQSVEQEERQKTSVES